jgi:hypothetical protein
MSSQDYLPTYNITSDFVTIAFFDAQDSELDFTWPFNSLKKHFIDFTKVDF